MGDESFTAEDYLEIQQLYARYAAALDVGDGSARAATFVPDGEFRSSITDQQPESVDVIRRRTDAGGSRGHRHINYNLIVTPTAEGADGLVFLLYMHKTGPDNLLHGQGMVYNDKLVRTDGGWRFKSRQVWPDALPDSPYGEGASGASGLRP